jgi:hypothetical protein
VWVLLLFLCALGLSGCSRAPDPPKRHLVILIDISASITKSAEEAAFLAIEDLVSRLPRGDRVSVIPITGDAQTKIQGRVLRFCAPVVREAYDQDRKKFANTVRNSLEETKASALQNPGGMTDILGTIRVAGEEFALDPPGTERHLVILSDFIEEDQEINFKTTPMLANIACSRILAQRVGQAEHLPQLTQVFLGSLQSVEFGALDRGRRNAITAFWRQFFATTGCNPVRAMDGPALMQEVLSSAQKPCTATAQ